MGTVRRILFLCCAATLLSVALFPVEIVLACIKYQAGRYCQKAFGAKLTYDSVIWKNGRVVFTNGSILRQGELEASFSKATLDPTLDLLGREIGGLLKIKGLRIVNRKIEEKSLPTPSALNLPFFTLNMKTIIHDGEVCLYDYLGTSPLFQRLGFDLEHHLFGKQTFGSIAFDWNESEPKLTTYFYEDKDSIFRLQTQFQGHSFPSLYDLMAYFFHAIMPEPMTRWNMRGGKIDGNLDITLLNGDPLRFKGELGIEELHAENNTLELIGAIEHFHAALDVDFSSVATMNGEFSLQGGKFALDETGDFWKGVWDLKNLNTTISVKEGKVDSSVLNGNFMGMDGEVILDWQSPDTLMRMGFEGHSKEISLLFPQNYQENFREAFVDDHFKLTAALFRAEGGLELEGKLAIEGEEEHLLDFGCLFGNGTDDKKLTPEALPFSLSRTVDAFLDHLAQQFCLSNKRFGWFSGSQFPVEKFVSPFLLSKVQMDAQGRVDFQGTFDERYLVISYEGTDLHLESPHFALHADCIEEEASTDVVAVHYFDFQTWSHVGFLPLRNAIYHQKNRDLTFERGRAMVHFQNNCIHIQEVEAYWQQILMKGALDFEIKAHDDVDLILNAHYLAGPATDAQKMLSHFSDSVFWEIPFQGEVESSGEVFTFKYHFTPQHELISGYLQGNFKGCIEKPSIECSGHVTYDLDGITIDITSDLCAFQGTITKDAILLDGEGMTLVADRDTEEMHIKNFVFGTMEGKGDIVWQGKEILFQNVKVHDEIKQAECSLSGAYDRISKVMHGDLEAFQWNFGETLSIWEPTGKILGSGTFEWSVAQGAEVDVAASFQGLEFGGIHFGDGDDLSCSYSSKYGATVEGLEVEIPTEKGVEKYKLGRFSYDLVEQKLLFEGFDFSLPPEKLPWVAELAANLFPGKVHPTLVDWVEALKQNEPLEGRISLEIYPDNIWVYLSLKDGTYYLSDNQFSFKDFLLLYDPHKFNIWTKVFFQDNDYWIHLSTDSETMTQGSLEVSEYELSPHTPARSQNALITQWARHGEEGWSIRDIRGNFHGLQLDLESPQPTDFSKEVKLDGRIGFDTEKVSSLLGSDLANVIENFSISGGYALDGSFSIPKSDLSQFSFIGTLTGSNFGMAGVELASFASLINYQPDQITLKNLGIRDWAGSLSIGQLEIVRNTAKNWELACDALKVEDVRLSRLKSPWTKWTPRKKPFFRSFYVRNFDLNHFEADLSDPESFKGSGSLEFTNLPKKTLFSNLLYIPTEITARIGLDLTALIPVRGTIDYQISNGKIIFNEFKDMYSDGKHSRFYLAEGTPAYVDFDGRLNFKLKMKQYNLLMKLAEFFTITVKGTLLNPKYTFTNQLED